MIHPAWLIAVAVVEAIAILYAVAFGFKAGYAAYKGDSPPEVDFSKLVPRKDDWDNMPAPFGPTEARRVRSIQLPEE